MIQTSFFKETEEVFVDPNGFKPRKLEEVVMNKDIPENMYMIYPSGGLHPFYKVRNTFTIYQQKIWPYIKRIKWQETFKGTKKSQVNCDLPLTGYPRITIPMYPEDAKARPIWDQLIHRLVAQAFIPNPEEKPLIMHRNDDSTNYLISNLKWGTPSENNKGAIGKRPYSMKDKYKNMLSSGIIKG